MERELTAIFAWLNTVFTLNVSCILDECTSIVLQLTEFLFYIAKLRTQIDKYIYIFMFFNQYTVYSVYFALFIINII
jgi:hypothetical protein